MPKMSHCTPANSTQKVRKNLAGDPFVVGDALHCPFCGQHVTITQVEADGSSFMPEHLYPTKMELRAMRRARL